MHLKERQLEKGLKKLSMEVSNKLKIVILIVMLILIIIIIIKLKCHPDTVKFKITI